MTILRIDKKVFVARLAWLSLLLIPLPGFSDDAPGALRDEPSALSEDLEAPLTNASRLGVAVEEQDDGIEYPLSRKRKHMLDGEQVDLQGTFRRLPLEANQDDSVHVQGSGSKNGSPNFSLKSSHVERLLEAGHLKKKSTMQRSSTVGVALKQNEESGSVEVQRGEVGLKNDSLSITYEPAGEDEPQGIGVQLKKPW